MTQANDQPQPASAAPVEQELGPVGWRYVPSEVWGGQLLTQHPKTAQLARDMGREVEPLYTEAQMLARVAAERERWEAALGAVMPADFKAWHQNSAMERPAVAAWVIRNLRDREAYLEGMLSDLEDEA